MCDGGCEDLGHPPVPAHHLLPGEPQDDPSLRDQFVIPMAVAVETLPIAVELEALGLDDDAQPFVGQVDDREELPIPLDPNLRGDRQPGDLQTDRPENRLDRFGTAPVSVAGNSGNPLPTAGRPVSCASGQLGGSDQATAQCGVRNGQRLVERQGGGTVEPSGDLDGRGIPAARDAVR